MTSLTREQADFVCNCVDRWIGIMEDELGRAPTRYDGSHSALLRRLLSGKEPLPDPPPLRHSYPDYRLAEGEITEVMELFDSKSGDYVVVDQHPYWQWHDKEKGILSYTVNGDLYRYWQEEKRLKKFENGTIVDGEPYMAKYLQKTSSDHA